MNLNLDTGDKEAQQKFCTNFLDLQKESDLIVNQSQLEAISLALKSKVALIQGPPGNNFLVVFKTFTI